MTIKRLRNTERQAEIKKITGCRLFLTIALTIFGTPVLATEIPFATISDIGDPFTKPHSIALHDLDQDGRLDVVATSRAGDELAYWYMTFLGNLYKRTIDSSLNAATAVTVADIDGDGDPDVIAAAGQLVGQEVAWWESDGVLPVPAWTKHSIDTAFAGARQLVAVDMDQDGDLDVLGVAGLAAGDNELVWWINDSTPAVGTWVKVTIDASLAGAHSVAVFDMDGDGDPDVVAGAKDDNLVAWWQNDGDAVAGTWTEFTIDAAFTGARSIAVSDIDGDGDPDVVGAAETLGDVVWWENNGAGGNPTLATWTERALDSNYLGAWSVVVRDMDQDGDPDVVATADQDDDVTWWENDGSPLNGGWVERVIDANFDGAQALAVGDLNDDGDMDVVGGGDPADKLAWWQNQTIHRSARFTDRQTVASALNNPKRVSAGDVDGDGDLDLLSTSTLDWHENTAGDGSNWTVREIDSSTGQLPVFVDIDDDGDLDVAGVINSQVHWWEHPGDPIAGTWIEHVVDNDIGATKPGHISDIEIVDFDGDGDHDLVVSYPSVVTNGGLISWWENPVDPVNDSWIEHVIEDSSITTPRELVIADFDGDGDPDVASALLYDFPNVRWWENDSFGMTWTEKDIGGGLATTEIVAADFSGDGAVDVAFADAFGAIDIRINSGDGTAWGTNGDSLRAGGNISPQGLIAADLDLDGDIDIAYFQGNDVDQLAWLENPTGSSSGPWIQHTIEDGTFNNGDALLAADLDNDGDPDLAGAGASESVVAWWRNEGGQFALETSDTAPAAIPNDEKDDVLKINAVHRGRTGDGDAELVSLELFVDDGTGTSLNDTQANNLIERLGIFLDDPTAGSQGIFDGEDDLLVAIETLSLTAGILPVSFLSSPDFQVSHGTPKTYYVVIELTLGASSQSPNTFAITNVTEASADARDAVNLIPLQVEYASNTSSSTVSATGSVTCYSLALSKTGNGLDPVAAPMFSAGCAAGEYVVGELVGLTAAPDSGWQVGSWTGTTDDSRTQTTNMLTMPASAAAASVNYEFPDYLTLEGIGSLLYLTTGDYEACIGITVATNVVINAGSDVTLRAADSIKINGYFRVDVGATLTIDPSLPTACSP